MEYVKLGRSGLTISKLCLGTMNFGTRTAEEESHTIMDLAVSKGINIIDTADVYGGQKGKGITEQIVGRWFSRSESNRNKIILATKVYGITGDGANDARLSAYHIIKACEDSLRRLNTDHIDLYQMHHIDRETTWDEIWQAMEKLVRDGKTLYVGSCNFAGWHIAKAIEAANKRNFFGLISEQSIYNLCVRTIELEVIPACRDYNVGLFTWSPLNGGLLACGDGHKAALRDNVRKEYEKYSSQLKKWNNFCKEFGYNPATMALAWIINNPQVTAPIIGPRTVDQVNDALKALDIELDEDSIRTIDEIWPGPGGPAPEAYAW